MPVMSGNTIRVALLSVNPTGSSGWARYTHDLITALVGCGVEVVLITSTDVPPVLEGLPITASHRVLPPLIPARRWSSIRLLASLPAVRQALANALRRLADDPALRQALGEAARQIAPRYSWKARAAQILETLRS